MPPILAFLLCALAVVAATPCSKPSEADIVWLVDSTALAPNELQAVADLIQAVGKDLFLAPEGGVRMGFVDAAARLNVGLADVLDYGEQLPEMHDAAAALEAVESEIFGKSKPGITRILILFSADVGVEAVARSLKNKQGVLVFLLHVGDSDIPRQDFVDFVFHAADFDELTTAVFQSSFLCLDVMVPQSYPTLGARSFEMPPAAKKRLAAGGFHFNYMQDNGEVFSWGYRYGLGAGAVQNSAFPLKMLNVSAASGISASTRHTCIVDGGAAKCCGWGFSGQLGNGANTDSYAMVQVQGLTAGVAQVVAGSKHSCAVLQNGGMKCWGYDYYGQLGSGGGTFSFIPVNVVNYTSGGVHSACAGYVHTCIVTTEGAVLCVGYGAFGQLGTGNAPTENIMTKVTGLKNIVTQISCGYYHTCALLSTGTLSCFGSNRYGELGMGDESKWV